MVIVIITLLFVAILPRVLWSLIFNYIGFEENFAFSEKNSDFTRDFDKIILAMMMRNRQIWNQISNISF